MAQIIFSSRRSVRFLLLDVGPGRRCVLKELTNFEHVPHLIGELSANCSPTFITINVANFEPDFITIYIAVTCKDFFLLFFITLKQKMFIHQKDITQQINIENLSMVNFV